MAEKNALDAGADSSHAGQAIAIFFAARTSWTMKVRWTRAHDSATALTAVCVLGWKCHETPA
jgi:hypothetical protein